MAGDELRHQREPRRLDRRTYFRLTNGAYGGGQFRHRHADLRRLLSYCVGPHFK